MDGAAPSVGRASRLPSELAGASGSVPSALPTEAGETPALLSGSWKGVFLVKARPNLHPLIPRTVRQHNLNVRTTFDERFWHISIQSSMTFRPFLLLAVGLVAGVAGGFVAGRNLATRARQTAAESNPTATVQTKAGAAKARRPLDTGAVAAPDTTGLGLNC